MNFHRRIEQSNFIKPANGFRSVFGKMYEQVEMKDLCVFGYDPKDWLDEDGLMWLMLGVFSRIRDGRVYPLEWDIHFCALTALRDQIGNPWNNKWYSENIEKFLFKALSEYLVKEGKCGCYHDDNLLLKEYLRNVSIDLGEYKVRVTDLVSHFSEILDPSSVIQWRNDILEDAEDIESPWMVSLARCL